MSDTRKNNDLDKPQYNSTLRLLKKLDGIKLDNAKIQVNIGEEQIERIHEKVRNLSANDYHNQHFFNILT
jgi:ribosome maturation protein Sdo1